MSKELKQQSNPFSTGGGGVVFENKVQAHFLLSLIIQSPIIALASDMQGQKIQFQAKYTGVNTDDLVLTAYNGKEHARLLIQIKHKVALGSAEKSNFYDVIKSAWSDFKSPNFSGSDRILLCTGPLSQQDRDHTITLLELAKTSSSSEEFFQKLETPQFTSKEKPKKLKIFKTQIERANGDGVTNEDLWNFLKIFNISQFDFDVSNSLDLQRLLDRIKPYSTTDPLIVFNAIVNKVQWFNQNAGSINTFSIPKSLGNLFDKLTYNGFRQNILELQNHTEAILSGINCSIDGMEIDRTNYKEKLLTSLTKNKIVFIRGDRGLGKSSLVKSTLEEPNSSFQYFYFRAEDFSKVSFNEIMKSLGANMTLSDLINQLDIIDKKIIVIESIEKILELRDTFSFRELLRSLKHKDGWQIIATIRNYAYESIINDLIIPENICFDGIEILPLEDCQKEDLIDRLKLFESTEKHSNNTSLFTIPFYIQLAVTAKKQGATFTDEITPEKFKRIIWSQVIAKEAERIDGMPSKRRETFIQIAVQQAKKMLSGIQSRDFLPEVVDKLIADGLILTDKNGFVSICHDCLEDWALEEFIVREDQAASGTKDFLSRIGCEPAINRAFREWLTNKIQDEIPFDLLIEILSTESEHDFGKNDEVITAILSSKRLHDILEKLKNNLILDNCALFKRFLFILKTTCQSPAKFFNERLPKNLARQCSQGLMLFVPDGDAWETIFDYIFEIKDELPNDFLESIVDALEVWSRALNVNTDFTSLSKSPGLLSLWAFNLTKERNLKFTFQDKIVKNLLSFAPNIKEEFEDLLEKVVFQGQQCDAKNWSLARKCLHDILLSHKMPLLCKHFPNIVTRSFYLAHFSGPQRASYNYSLGMGGTQDEEFGLKDDSSFSPESAYRGPFYFLLQNHFQIGLELIIDLCNKCTVNYVDFLRSLPTDEAKQPNFKTITLTLNDGTEVKQYASIAFWLAYRGMRSFPQILQCALMALEMFLIEIIKFGTTDDVANLYSIILKKSNNIMTTAVLSSVAMGFPDKVGKAIFPILRKYELYEYDYNRSCYEKSFSPLQLASFHFQKSANALYKAERSDSANLNWRKTSLANLIFYFQGLDLYSEEAFEIVNNIKEDLKKVGALNTDLKHMICRIDFKNFKTVQTDNGSVLSMICRPEPSEKDIEDGKKFELLNEYIELEKKIKKQLVYSEKISDYGKLIARAKNLSRYSSTDVDDFYYESGIIKYTTIICVRDCFSQLESADKKWCVKTILGEINRVINNSAVMTGRGGLDTTCVYILPKLLTLKDDAVNSVEIRNVIATFLTCVNFQIVTMVALGIRNSLWQNEKEIAQNFLTGAIEFSKYCKKNELESCFQSKSSAQELEEFRHKLVCGHFHFEIDDYSCDTTDLFNFHIPMFLLPIGTNDEQHLAIINKIVRIIIEVENKSYSDKNYDFTNIRTKDIADCLAEHLMFYLKNNISNFNLILPLLKASIIRAPQFFLHTLLACDKHLELQNDFAGMWKYWSLFTAELSIVNKKIEDTTRSLRYEYQLLLTAMLNINDYKVEHENIQKIMRHGKDYLIKFVNEADPTEFILRATSSWMDHFSDVFLEECLIILSDKRTSFTEQIKQNKNVAFQIESSIRHFLLTNHLNSKTLPRKQFEACFNLLTIIFEAGSAAAYSLKEELIKNWKIYD